MHWSLALRGATGFIAVVLSAPAISVENASTHAALGFTDSLLGWVVDEGFYVRNDILGYRSTRLNDRHGKAATANFGAPLSAVGVPLGAPGTSGRVRLEVSGTYEQLTLFRQFAPAPFSFLGIDSLGFGATLLYGSQRVELNAEVPAFLAFGQTALRDLGSAKVSSLGDTAIFPLYLGWKPNGSSWSFTANPLNFYLKTGQYHVGRSQNLGRNYNSWAPQFAVTYLEKGRELSAQLNYLKNARNSATNYKSGDEVFLSFGVFQWLAPPPLIKLGLSGYYYKQLSDDRRGGAKIYSARDPLPDLFDNGVGNRGEVAALGPSVEVLIDRWTLGFHWNHEFHARNLPQADRIWLKVAYRF